MTTPSDDARQLVRDLDRLQRASQTDQTGDGKKSRQKLLRSHLYPFSLQDGTQITLTSWNMLEWAYKEIPCPFPTKARGLFTCLDSKISNPILVRGYDKFFNVGEVTWTKWENIDRHASAPFYLTVKSNGCIIFISALSCEDLVVTSKHALTDVQQNGDISHSAKGKEWLDKALASAGSSQISLAKLLFANSWTFVAELCDDSFEEHVLAYAPEETGLHLHGINLNSRDLRTLAPDLVAQYAKQFGFIETKFLKFSSLDKVQEFTEGCSKDDGRWNGKHIEGFVVRASLKDASPSSPEGQAEEVFMFKVKFDQPYLLWRRWRELTRRMLTFYRKQLEENAKAAARMEQKVKSAPEGQRAKIRQNLEAETEQDETVMGINLDKERDDLTKTYILWAAQQMKDDLSSFDEWKCSRGIVRTREAFLAWHKQNPDASTNGHLDNPKQLYTGSQRTTFNRSLIVPIGIPGCGKTAIGIALHNLFGFAHTQSDDVQSKSTKAIFLQNVSDLLKKETVVYADRNNHQSLHRAQLLGKLKEKSTKKMSIRKIALAWDIDSHPSNIVQNICNSRILSRGDKHQSVRADLEDFQHEATLAKFLHEREPFDAVLHGDSDGQFDEVLKVDPTLPLRPMLRSIVEQLMPVLNLETRSDTDIEAAVSKAEMYAPSVYKEAEGLKPRYYGIAIRLDLAAFVKRTVSDPSLLELVKDLEKARLVVQHPHITLVHSNEVEQKVKDASDATTSAHAAVWGQCEAIARRANADATDVHAVIGPRIVWNDRVAAIEVSSIGPVHGLDLAGLNDGGRLPLHITIGWTAEAAVVGAVAGKHLIEQLWRAPNDVSYIDIGEHQMSGRIKGMV